MGKRSSKPAGKARRPERFTCLDIAFKNNDQLKTDTALHKEAAKIEFKVVGLDKDNFYSHKDGIQNYFKYY